jgi:hypothetical protein
VDEPAADIAVRNGFVAGGFRFMSGDAQPAGPGFGSADRIRCEFKWSGFGKRKAFDRLTFDLTGRFRLPEDATKMAS